MTFDLIVRGGRIVDGTGFPAYLGDVAIQDGRMDPRRRTEHPAHRPISFAPHALPLREDARP